MGNESVDDESKVNYDDPKSVEEYLEHNLREGYLSEEEQKFVNNLVEELETSPDLDEVQEKVKQIQLNRGK